MRLEINSNARELQRKYNNRANMVLRQSAMKPQVFAIGLMKIRQINLQKLVYDKSPYIGNKAPTGELYRGERAVGGLVYNITPYSTIRMRMKGTYKDGSIKEADWGGVSFVEYLPIVRLQEVQMNRNILRG
jgi:hypothetical protein